MVSSSDEMGERYLIVQPANGGITDLLRYGIFNNKASGSKFLLQHQQQQQQLDDDDDDKRFVIIVSIIMRKLIKVFGKPMEWTGYVVDFILNLLSLNGGLLPLFANLFQGSIFLIYPIISNFFYVLLYNLLPNLHHMGIYNSIQNH
ncbi:hypothetical protein Hanom_Chr09g00871631 [Helianthus anomalus]